MKYHFVLIYVTLEFYKIPKFRPVAHYWFEKNINKLIYNVVNIITNK